ncbi:MAG TPA: MarP family serine protease [Nitriliruptorales bacterium]
MNLLDLLLIVAMAAGAVSGYRLGLLARAAMWAGAIGGVFLAVWVVPRVVQLVPDGEGVQRLIVAIVAFVAVIGLVSSLGEYVGLRIRHVVHRTPARPVDRAGGLGVGVLGVLLLVWLMVPALTEVPGAVSRQARSSTIAQWVAAVAPRPPDPVQSLRRLVGDSPFPDVFADLRPAPDTGPPPEQIPVPPEVVARVTASTVNVEADGCGARSEGSGWAAAPDTIVTNAHVVAGTSSIQVRRPDGRVLPATVVVFDDRRDVAVLQVDDLGQEPLAMAEPQPGSDAVEVGYPGGQNEPRAAPARVSDVRTTVGRDIYGSDRTEREVVFLAASLRKGDSGAPVADVQGAVVGTVFAIAADRSTTAYALAPSEVRAALGAPRNPGAAGRCL